MTLTANRYGKERVRLVRVRRDAEHHELQDMTVKVLFSGDYAAAFAGDNRDVLPTDTMKNTVYALARRETWDEPEELAGLLADHFLAREAALSTVEIEIEERLWPRVVVDGAPHPHAFAAPRVERRLARVRAGRAGAERSVEAGVEGLALLKTSGSGFADFRRDELTTLAPTDDRLLSTLADVRWRYGELPAEPGAVWNRVRDLLVDVFARHPSRSVQHTLQAMGDAVLAAHPRVEEVRLRLPNRHHHRVDLAPFGLDNPDEIYVATDEPFGIIEGTVRR
jgi:urate oxidase